MHQKRSGLLLLAFSATGCALRPPASPQLAGPTRPEEPPAPTSTVPRPSWDPAATGPIEPGRIPGWLQSRCSAVTVKTTRRPCTTYSCPRETTTLGPCTPMPSELAFPPASNGVSGCDYLYYTGPACRACGDNYCNADGACPLGQRTTTASRHCGGEPRCASTRPLPACPSTRWAFTPGPWTATSGCDVEVLTGSVCSGCPTYCTVPATAGVQGLPAGVDPAAQLTGCAGAITTSTTDRICYRTCSYTNYPTQCVDSYHNTATAAAALPTDTFGCTAYVQTGSKSCQDCLPFCTGRT